MYQTIAEPIAVAGVYAQGAFCPRKFRWGKRQFQVEEVTFVTDYKNGGVRFRQYSVVAAKTTFRLVFNRDTEDWELKEVWDESALAAS